MSSALSQVLAYCGAPPIPAEIWRNWNLDPVLIAALFLLLGAYVRASGPARGAVEPWRRTCFYSGWGVLAAGLVSPLCSLTVALFSARIAQHMALLLIAAPLLVLGRPQVIFGPLRRLRPAGLTSSSTIFAFFLWLWHTPVPYDATLTSTFVYWTMHLSMLASALVLWHALLGTGEARLRGIVAAIGTSAQMGLLGAIITLAPRPLYESHLATTWPWGVGPLEDQQLGGLLMWVPGGLAFLFAALVILAGLLKSMESSGARPPATTSRG